MMRADIQYKQIGREILRHGVWEENARTGTKCLTILDANMMHTPSDSGLLTIKQVFWKPAVAEMLGYLKGFTNAQDFADLGAKTWFANANETPAWLANPNRKGENDMGKVYGAVAQDFNGVNLFTKVYHNLSNGIDDRGEIITFWNPSEFDKGCLRPCMFQHHFSLLGGYLHLTSYQRSADFALGVPFNMVQTKFLLTLMAQITGHKVGNVYHKMVNVHLYENQIDTFREQMKAPPTQLQPKIVINPHIKNWEDALAMTVDDVDIVGYSNDLPRFKYPFTV